jgi:hypothetical protein
MEMARHTELKALESCKGTQMDLSTDGTPLHPPIKGNSLG